MNVVIVNTPFKLILAQAIVSHRFKSSKNVLIVFESEGISNIIDFESPIFKQSLWHKCFRLNIDTLNEIYGVGSRRELILKLGVFPRQFSQRLRDHLSIDQVDNILFFLHLPSHFIPLSVEKKGESIAIDEGFNSYYYILTQHSIGSRFSTSMHSARQWAERAFLRLSRVKRYGVPDEYLFLHSDIAASIADRKGESLNIKQIDLDHVRESFAQIHTDCVGGDSNDMIANADLDTLLYLPQPFSEMGLMSFDDECGFVSDICKTVIKKGCRLIIKPHPRESVSKIDFYQQLHNEHNKAVQVYPHKTIPIEILMYNSDIRYVIGYFSSSLMNLEALCGKIPISLFRCVLGRVSERNQFEYMRKILCFFEEHFGKQMKICHEMEDLI